MSLKRLFLTTASLLPLLAILPAARAQAPNAFSPNPDGTWSVSTPTYKSVINKAGYLSSLTVGGVEAVGDPFSYQPNAKLVADKWTADGSTLTVHLKGDGEATIEYASRPDGITITPTWKGNGFADMHFNASHSLLGIELLNSKRPSEAGEAIRFVEHGEVRGVPAFPSSRNQMVRFHYPRFNIHAYVQAWGAPFNYESAGGIDGYRWGRQLLSANQAFPIVFDIETTPAGPTLPALAFAPHCPKTANLYYTDEPCTWNIDLGTRKSYQYLLDAGVTSLTLHWRLTDVHDAVAAEGTAPVPLDPTATASSVPVTIRPPGSGYFGALFSLVDPSGKALTSSFLTRFTVIHRIPGMINRDDSQAGKGFSDYSIMGMIGIGAIRESHNMSEFFTNAAQTGAGWAKVDGADPGVWMNTGALDSLFNFATAESQKYHLTYFFQANSRPAYATPAVYEAMAFALVSRYKDRCHTWEVENEPNFTYSPDNYVKQALIPFSTGAKRADPACVVMGPDCVSLKQTLEFMGAVYSLGAAHYLDNISTHSYPGPGESWEQFGNTATIPELRRLMAAHGDAAKPLWQTEQGYAWDNSPQSEAARYTVRQFLQGWRMGILPEHQYYFYPQWHGFEDWYLQGSGEEGSRDSWLPGGAALRFLAENTHGMTYAGDIPSPYKGIYLSRFTGPDEDVVAAWTFDFPTVLRIRASGLTRVVGYMGNPVAAPPVNGVVSLSLSGEPIYIHLRKGTLLGIVEPPFGRNVAADGAGATAVASSEAPDHPASFANDGNWNLWEDVPGLKGRTAWQSGRKDPSQAAPDWLQVNFPLPRTIDRMVALCYLPAVNPSPRDFLFQVGVNGKWRTVASGKDEFTWTLERQFPAVTTTKIRMVITKINDGWHGDRRWMHVLMGPKATNYTDSKVLVSELEAYGP
ncbi:MAG: discoidin domain-containing protein, partial [Armatimonadota bacterium]|nr:discoidin domain-containing protein [Armatimonadota bacterium]